jgi:hypothetical protein
MKKKKKRKKERKKKEKKRCCILKINASLKKVKSVGLKRESINSLVCQIGLKISQPSIGMSSV